MFLFFFFQAEDGIRDGRVTGVQTCALPILNRCDTLLIVGSSFPYSEFLPKEGQARGIQIDIDPKRLSVRYPTEINLVGDSAETLRAFIPLLTRKQDRQWRKKIEAGIAEWWKVLEARAM